MGGLVGAVGEVCGLGAGVVFGFGVVETVGAVGSMVVVVVLPGFPVVVVGAVPADVGGVVGPVGVDPVGGTVESVGSGAGIPGNLRILEISL